MWEVLVRTQAYINVEADTQEEAEAIAESEFDPTAYDVDVVESYEVEE
jgi:hypothetical protein